MYSQDQILTLKAICLGELGSGKKSLIERATNNNWQSEFLHTLGVQFKIKQYVFEKTKVRVQFWQTFGMERYRFLPQAFWRGSKVMLLCFDLNDKVSFQKLKYWIDLKAKNAPGLKVFVIGCKSDLKHEVVASEIEDFMTKNGLIYFETSAKENKGVHESFETIFRIIALQEINNNANYSHKSIELSQKSQQSFIPLYPKSLC